MAELPESNQRRAAGRLARLRSRLVGILPPGRRTPPDFRTGRLDQETHPKLLLATLARLAWTAGQTPTIGAEGSRARGGAQFQRSLAHCWESWLTDRTEQRRVAKVW